MITMGIDPARGWAIVKVDGRDRRVLEAGTVPGVEEMLNTIDTLSSRYEICDVRVERPANKSVRPRPGTTTRAMQKISHNVGENRAKADEIIRYCRRRGLQVNAVYPIRRGTKLDPAQIKALTGYEGKTSEHARDAIVLAWCR